MKTNSLDFDAQALREKILDLAMRGKLVKQDPNDEPASALLEKIKAEKAELVKEKKIKKSKPLPEITDDEKPFHIPDSWKWVRGEDIVSLIGDGLHGTPVFSKEGVPFVNGSNLIDGKISLTKSTKFVSEEEYLKYKKDLLPGTLFLSLNGTLGKVAKYHNEKIVLGKSAGYFSLIDVKMQDFIFYFLQSAIFKKYYDSKYTGSVIKNIPLKALRECIIPLPPLEEQSRIAAKIAQLFALLRKVESSTQQYAKLQSLLKSKVLDLAMRGKLVKQDPHDEPASVLLEKEGLKESNEIPHQIPNSWSWIVLGSGVKFINGRAYKKSELLNDSSLTPILRVGNLFTNSSYYYSDLKLNPDKYIDNGDLIYAWSASFGPQIWTGGHVIYHYHIWKVIPKQIIEKQFLYYFLLDKRNVIGETDLHGSTMKHITKTNMEHLSFPLPPLSEQKRIVKKINFLLEIL